MKARTRALPRILAPALLGGLGWTLLLTTCAKERPTSPEPVPPVSTDAAPESLTVAGWAAFENGTEAEAARLFAEALAISPNYAPALTGEGWSRLATAATRKGFIISVLRFDAALDTCPSDSVAAAGRAAALLAADSLDAAIEAAGAARRLHPRFVFPHRPSFTARDLDLVEAIAQASRGDFARALHAVDPAGTSGIIEDRPETWVVNGLPMRTFADAVLAHLARVARSEAG